MSWRKRVGLSCIAQGMLLLGAGFASGAATFTPINSEIAPEPFGGGPFGPGFSPLYDGAGRALGISPDGRIVVGSTANDIGSRKRAWSWTAEGGVVALPYIDNGATAGTRIAWGGEAKAVANNGTIIGSAPGAGVATALVWPGAVRPAPTQPQQVEVAFNDISPDGSVMVGRAQYLLPELSLLPGGPIRNSTYLGTLSQHQVNGQNAPGEANAISHDGQVIVGWSSRFESPSAPTWSGPEAFRWTQGGGMVSLGDLAGGALRSIAHDANSDGSVIVGISASGNGDEAFLWRSATNSMIGLGDLPGGSFQSIANAVSGDGSIVVGSSNDEAFIWDEANGMRSLASVLEGGGANLNGWTLQVASDISANGITVTGWGTDPTGKVQPFVAQLPEPSVLLLVPATALVLGRRRNRRS